MVNEELKKLYDERLKIDNDQRAMIDKVEKEKRSFTADEETEYQKMDTRFSELTGLIKQQEESLTVINDRKAKHEERKEMFKAPVKEPIKMDPVKDERETRKRVSVTATPEYRAAFADHLACNVGYDEIRSRFMGNSEIRALQADKETVGGFLIVPEQFMTDLIADLKNLTFFRQIARTINMPKAQRIVWPVLKNTVSAPVWRNELTGGPADSSMSFGRIELFPHPSVKSIRISESLIRTAAIDIESLVRNEFGYEYAVTEEQAFLTGTGAGQPLGVFIASADGISTDRDVSTGNTATEIKADNLIDCKYKMEAQWRAGCQWLFHRDAIKMIRKLKAGDGTYLWKAGISSDRPDTILDYPVRESEYVPSTFTTGLYVGILGNFSYYLIVTALDMRMKVADQLYIETNEIGYFSRMEVDGAPIREKAFVRVKLA